MVLFGNRSGSRVRLAVAGARFSFVFGGAPQVSNTREVGLFGSVEEPAIAAGVRRIEAVTGWGLAGYIERLRGAYQEKATEHAELVERVHSLERQLDKLRFEQLVAELLPQLLSTARIVGGVQVVTGTVPVQSAEHLRLVAEALRQRLAHGGIGLLAAQLDGKLQLVCAVTDDLAAHYHAGKLVSTVAARLGGKGGGRPTLATAGARDIEQLDAVLSEFPHLVEQWIPQD